MNTPTIIRRTSPADPLATLPRMLGFEPCAGVYLIPFTDKRAMGALRADLPSPDLIAPYDTPHPSEEALAWMEEVMGLVSFAERVAIIIHTDSPFAGESGTPSYYGWLRDRHRPRSANKRSGLIE